VTESPKQPSSSAPSRPGSNGLLLAVVGTVLIGYCLFDQVPLTNVPPILVGSLLIILAAFHPRIHGQIGIGKFHVSVISEQRSIEVEDPPDPAELERRRRAARATRQREAEEMEWSLPKRRRYR
jgi:hypothetical protein